MEKDDQSCKTVVVCNENKTLGLEDEEIVKLRFLTHERIGESFIASAAAFEQAKAGTVSVQIIQVGVSQLLPDIMNEATSRVGLYDGFFANPAFAGSVVEHNGWADLTDYIQESQSNTADWGDILLGYRQWTAQYQDQIIMYPLDGDVLSLFYRKDVLTHFGLPVPRTWDEYNEVAKRVHGLEYEGKILAGSCVGREVDCSNAYWVNLLLSSITQTQGAWSGHLFDTEDMKPLLGVALEKALKWLEGQVKYGFEGEFDSCIKTGNSMPMKAGECVLTYNWGNSFKQYLREPSELRGKFGVAATPGSSKVLDRDTMQLVPCDADRCKHGDYYEDIGWVNRAPYMAFGGWSCAVNNYTTTEKKKRLATEFCAFASSKEQSIKAIISNATAPFKVNGQDPYRKSHLDLDYFEAQGYEKETAEDYIEAILFSLNSKNVVTEVRFPTASDLYSVLDEESTEYLRQVKDGLITASEMPAARRVVADRIKAEFEEIVTAYDQQGTTKVSVLDAYQKLRGVYIHDYDLNQINAVRGFGICLAVVAMFCAFGFAAWTLYARKAIVVKASQPFFLVILCVGALILSSAIIPMGIDDSVVHSDVSLDISCMSIPWLLALGWSIIFAALYSKLLRVNKVLRNSRQYKRVEVTVKDVTLVFAIIVTWNIHWLLIWTVLDPLSWNRVETSDSSSFGYCGAGSSSSLWKICASMVCASNGVALVLANIEAIKARHISTEFGETKYVGMAMGSILQVTLIGVPVMFLVNENPSATYFVRTTIVFVAVMSILTLIFVPKIYIWLGKAPRPKSSLSMANHGQAVAVKEGSSSGASNQRGDGGYTSDYSYQLSEDAALFLYKKKVYDFVGILKERGIDVDLALIQAGLVRPPRAFTISDAESSKGARGDGERMRLSSRETSESRSSIILSSCVSEDETSSEKGRSCSRVDTSTDPSTTDITHASMHDSTHLDGLQHSVGVLGDISEEGNDISGPLEVETPKD